MSDESATVISQRQWPRGGPVFHFGQEHLQYFGAHWDFKAKYEHIVGPSQYQRRKTSDRLVAFTFFYLIVLALFLLWRDQAPHYGLDGWYWFLRSAGGFIAITAVICGSAYYLVHRDFTVVSSPSGNILVMRDRRHDTVIERLQSCRRRRLRQLSAPDPANSPEEELIKLKWLQDEGAITQDEYEELCSRVRGGAPPGGLA